MHPPPDLMLFHNLKKSNGTETVPCYVIPVFLIGRVLFIFNTLFFIFRVWEVIEWFQVIRLEYKWRCESFPVRSRWKPTDSRLKQCEKLMTPVWVVLTSSSLCWGNFMTSTRHDESFWTLLNHHKGALSSTQTQGRCLISLAADIFSICKKVSYAHIKCH